MTIAFWIVAGVTALVFIAAGTMKLARSPEALKSSGLAWVEDFSPVSVKLIGAAEVLGGLGLIVPGLTGIVPVLSPIAGICLALLMIGATITHIRRGEPPISLFLVVLASASAVLGFLTLL